MNHSTNPAYLTLSGQHNGLEARKVLNLNETKPIAFYLPQFHRIPENNKWWGPGFTEWTNVAKAKPNFDNHNQPHIPADLGFYDLSHISVMQEQVDLAKEYGLYGFCFYYYWFSGRRILEKPIDQFLASDIQFPYCLCWANENWTRTWDGDQKSVLIEQKYAENDPELFIEDLKIHLTDPRYIKYAGVPMLLVYRGKAIPDPVETFKRWRKHALAIGIGEIHIALVDFYDISTPEEIGADSLVEFPPHKFNLPGTQYSASPQNLSLNFKGFILDYRKSILVSIGRKAEKFKLFRSVMPGWDNTARRQDTSTIFVESSPFLFELWLKYIRAWTAENHSMYDGQYLFVNAWNEWAEGAHLEPDTKLGLANLRALLGSARNVTSFSDAKSIGNEVSGLLSQEDYLGKLADEVMRPKAQVTHRFLQFISDTSRKIPGLQPLLKRLYYFWFK